MPEWMTPELWPVWCEPRRGSFSRITRRAPGRRSRSARAVARPTMPPPTIAMSWVMELLLERRKGGRPPDLVDDPLHERPVRLRRLPPPRPSRAPLKARHAPRPGPTTADGAEEDGLVRPPVP